MAKIYFRVHVFFEDSYKDLRPSYDYVIEWLCEHNFNAVKTDFIDVFEVCFENINNEVGKNKKKELLDIFLLAVSLRNRMGFFISDISENPQYKAWEAVPPEKYALNDFIKTCKDNQEFLERMKEIRSFYMQVEQRSKVILGVSLIEKLFPTKVEHILSKSEKNKVINAIKNLHLKEDKEAKIISVIKDSNFMADKTRNVRIVTKISKYLNEDERKTLSRIKTINETRNKKAHDTMPNDKEEKLVVEQLNKKKTAVEEIEYILDMYLVKEFGFFGSLGLQFIDKHTVEKN